jgi:hypothetical protein
VSAVLEKAKPSKSARPDMDKTKRAALRETGIDKTSPSVPGWSFVGFVDVREVPPMRASVLGNIDKNQGQHSKLRSTMLARHRASEMLTIVNCVLIALLFSCLLMLV